MQPINALHRRLLAAEPTLDLFTLSGRVTALGMIGQWLDHCGQCLEKAHALQAAGDRRAAAKPYQQWFNLTIQIGQLHDLIHEAIQLHDKQQAA